MGCILDDLQVVMLGDLQDSIHLAGLLPEMDRDDRLRL